jgi:hypothetical protein
VSGGDSCRDTEADGTPIDVAQFQFHNGSIKSFCHLSVWYMINGFQFHNGSIKSTEEPYNGRNARKFQFHNGSIKSDTEADGTPIDVAQFQFHNGSIKSHHL